MKHWRTILARLPLPMLAVAASYGVFRFALLYVPWQIAVVQAAAFEVTYIGLATARGLDAGQRKRATAISVGAVVVSIIYNSLAGLFHRNPEWLIGLPWYAEAMLAALHGAPLAWVAYLVADLLLHTDDPQPTIAAMTAKATERHSPAREIATPIETSPVVVVADVAGAMPDVVRMYDVDRLSYREIGRQLGISGEAARQRYTKAKQNGHVKAE